MMNKLLIVCILALLLLCSMVAAAPQTNVHKKNVSDAGVVKERSEVKGLENAMLHVRNNETVAHLEQVLAKIQTRQMEQLNKQKNLVVEEAANGEVVVSFTRNAKFLGVLDMSKQHKYTVNDDGTVSYRRGQLDFLFKMETALE